MDADRLIRIYRKQRAAKAALTKEYETAKAKIDDDMRTVEGLLQGLLIQNKVKSMSSTSGTAYVETSRKPNCVDWAAYGEWLAATGGLTEGLEKRVSKAFIDAYRRDHDDELPPGIVTFDEQVIRVRAAADSD